MSSVYAVIQKNRTEIWEDDFSKRAHPITIYEPGSIPKGVHHVLDAVSSTYDVASIQRANKTYQLIPSWLKPNLEHGYERRIYQHLKKFDQVYLVGSGLGRWSGINSFMNYATDFHPQFVGHIQRQRRLRFTDFPHPALFEIFREMSRPLH